MQTYILIVRYEDYDFDIFKFTKVTGTLFIITKYDGFPWLAPNFQCLDACLGYQNHVYDAEYCWHPQFYEVT